MLKAVIFDMDGVMVDTERIHSLAYAKVLKEYGVTPVKNEYGAVQISGATTPETWEILKVRYGFKADTNVLTEKKRQVMLEALNDSVEPMEGLVILLDELSDKSIKLAVATSAQRERAELVLKKLDIERYFQTIITANDIKNGKPAPDIYIKTANEIGVDPSDCVVIEDALVGVESAVSAGMKVIAVPNEYTISMDFSKATVQVNSLADLSYSKLSELFG